MLRLRSLPRRSLALAFLAALAHAEDKPGITPHQVASLRSVSSAAISPDGKEIAYTLSVPRKAGEDDDGPAWTELHLYDVASAKDRTYIGGKADVGSVAWTPDGSGIGFLAKRGDDKFNRLYVIAKDGGEARAAVKTKSAISAYSFAPDGKRVAFVASDPEPENVKKLQDKGFKQEIYEEDWRPDKLWIATLYDEEAAPVALDVKGSLRQVKWNPTNDTLAISVTPTPLVDDEYMRIRVQIVDAATGDMRAKIENPGKLGAFAWSPDGKRVALISAADKHDPSAGRLTIATEGSPIDVLPNYPGDVVSFAWQDADDILYVAAQGVATAFEKVSIQSGGSPKTLIPTSGPVLQSVSLSKDGKRAAFVASTPENPPELFTMQHGDSSPTRCTNSNPWLADVGLAKQEVVRLKARDGLELEGVLVRPLGEVARKLYPLILCVHGGPEAHDSNGWSTNYSRPGQMAAARGIAVFYPNYRGSTGRGVAFSKLSQGDPAGKEFDDLVDCVDHLVATGLVDKERVGITGGSYGGYATGWCSTRYSDRFAAGVMFVGIGDNISKVGTTDIPDEDYYVHSMARPWENWQFLLERSPIYHAGDCKTPLLILGGKDDPRVNPGQSREMYRHLKLRSKAPVRLVMYPGEQHGNRKAAARLDYNLRMLEWMEHYLVGPGGEPPPHTIDYEDPAKKKDA